MVYASRSNYTCALSSADETQELPCMWGTGTFHAHTSQRIAHTPTSHASSTCTTHALGSFFCSGIVCLDPIIPSFLQFILKRLHVHIHILPLIVGPRNYQRQENVLSLHNLSGGGIEWNDKYRPTILMGYGHT